MTDSSPPRRTVLAGIGVLSLGGIAGCAVYGDKEESAARPAAGATLAKTTDIPEGGGVIFDDVKLVVTQPEAGTFKAFSAVCTHQSCLVGNIEDGVIICPCHNSEFDLNGQVLGGPAPAPLPEEAITVDGENIVLS